MKNIDTFCAGLGLGYLITKYNVIGVVAEIIIEVQRLRDVENVKTVDVFGDDIVE